MVNNAILHTYIDVNPVVASIDLHDLREASIRGGATIAYNAVFQGGYYLREAIKQSGSLLEEIQYLKK